MVEQLSPLEPVWKPGAHGKVLGGAGVAIEETQPGSIVQAAAFPGEERTLIATIRDVTGLALPDGAGGGVAADGKAAFGFAPGRFLVVDQNEGLGLQLKAAVLAATGTVTDLSHGRTAIRISGPKAEWVLAKFFAIDFSLPAFPGGRRPLDRPSRHLRADPAHRRRSSSTSTSSARSRARSGRRCATPARKSATR